MTSSSSSLFKQALGEIVSTDLTEKIKQVYFVLKQAMITLGGMAEHRFTNVYNYQCCLLVMHLYTWIQLYPSLPRIILTIDSISFVALHVQQMILINF